MALTNYVMEKYTTSRLYTLHTFLKKLLTPTQRNSLEYIYREEGKANDDSE